MAKTGLIIVIICFCFLLLVGGGAGLYYGNVACPSFGASCTPSPAPAPGPAPAPVPAPSPGIPGAYPGPSYAPAPAPRPPPPVNCQVSGWSDSGSCTATACGTSGTKPQTRTVITPAANGGTACPPMTQNVPCNGPVCPVDCQVSGWSDSGSCSVTMCEATGGTKTQTRTITTPAANGGTACPPLSQTVPCNGPVCVTCTGHTSLNTTANQCDACTQPSNIQKWKSSSGCEIENCGGGRVSDSTRTTCDCPSGYIWASNRGICDPLPANSHLENGAAVCNSGYKMGSTGCVLIPTTCPLGYTLPSGFTDCQPCPVDTYKDNTGVGTCTPCQNGLFHSPEGSTSASACQVSTTCGPGSQLNIDLINVSAGCSACPKDTYKAGTNSGQCTPCPSGQTTYGQTGQTACQTKSNWWNGTTCTSNYGFDVTNYRDKTSYCNDYIGDNGGNNDPCCRPPAAVQQQTPPPPPPPPPPAGSCNCDYGPWDESVCGGTWVDVCRPDRDGGH